MPLNSNTLKRLKCNPNSNETIKPNTLKPSESINVYSVHKAIKANEKVNTVMTFSLFITHLHSSPFASCKP